VTRGETIFRKTDNIEGRADKRKGLRSWFTLLDHWRHLKTLYLQGFCPLKPKQARSKLENYIFGANMKRKYFYPL
jgi:hypothetical protein